MTTPIIREITKLARQVNFKYASLAQRITQLELNQTASSQVTDIVALISGLTVGLSYTATPSSFVPNYTLPTASS